MGRESYHILRPISKNSTKKWQRSRNLHLGRHRCGGLRCPLTLITWQEVVGDDPGFELAGGAQKIDEVNLCRVGTGRSTAR